MLGFEESASTLTPAVWSTSEVPRKRSQSAARTRRTCSSPWTWRRGFGLVSASAVQEHLVELLVNQVLVFLPVMGDGLPGVKEFGNEVARNTLGGRKDVTGQTPLAESRYLAFESCCERASSSNNGGCFQRTGPVQPAIPKLEHF